MDVFQAFLTRVENERASSGPLAELRLAVKDNIAVKGQPFTAGLPLFDDRRAQQDAPCIARLKDAGACFVGMTRTDSAGFGVVTPEVKNPVWPERIVGGSSGGSAAAVAAGLADIGIGTDTGGSTRIPAACCSIFGFKPGHGLIPTDGVWPLAASFDVVGWMTRELTMLEQVATVLLDISRAEDIRLHGLRLGIDPDRLARSAPEIRQAIDAVQAQLSRAGAQFFSVALPPHDVVSHAHAVTVLTEAKAVYPGWFEHADRLPATARRSLAVAQNIGAADVAIAQAERAAIVQAFDAACAGVDAILTPTLPVEPPAVGLNKLTLHGRSEPIVSVLASETCLANITGAPALSMPIPETLASLQLLAPKQHDARLFAIARALQTVIGGGLCHRV
jgi:Asp-tRNA(Asn)/Glu-tRNA(Gln) amidotransferase A subunit family amidase